MRGLSILSVAVVFVFAVSGVRAGEADGGAWRGVEKTSAFSWNADVKYPELGHAEIDAQIRGWIDDNVVDCLDEVKELGTVDGIDLSWTMSVDYEVTAPSDRAVSVIFTTYTYTLGAAHPMRVKHVLSFDADSGAVLSLDDLFADPEKALAVFSENAPRLVLEEMRADYPDSFADGAEPAQAFFEEGFEPMRDNYAEIGLEPGGVRVYFQLYQVLPYVFGTPSALFTLDMLKEAGPKTGYWEK